MQGLCIITVPLHACVGALVYAEVFYTSYYYYYCMSENISSTQLNMYNI